VKEGYGKMQIQQCNYQDYFHPGQRATVQISVDGSGVFRDGAVVTAVEASCISLRLSRDHLPERAQLHPDAPLLIRVGGSDNGYSCSGVVLQHRPQEELRVVFVGEVMPEDSREFFRLNTEIPLVLFNVSAGTAEESGFGRLGSEGTPRLPRIVNISGGGFRTETRMGMRPGDTVYATFQLPLPQPEVVPVVAQVVYSEAMEREEAPMVSAGLHFVHLSERDRDSIVRYVCNEEMKRIRLSRKKFQSVPEKG
jgi:hypothetical protein